MSRLLLLIALVSLGGCASVHRFMVAPHDTIRHYHRWERKHERERRRRVKHHPNILWSQR